MLCTFLRIRDEKLSSVKPLVTEQQRPPLSDNALQKPGYKRKQRLKSRHGRIKNLRGEFMVFRVGKGLRMLTDNAEEPAEIGTVRKWKRGKEQSKVLKAGRGERRWNQEGEGTGFEQKVILFL